MILQKLGILNPVDWIPSVFYIGKIEHIGPAIASLVGMISAAVILHFWGMNWLILATILLFVIGIIISQSYIATAGSEDEVVLDEVVGCWIVIIAAYHLGYYLTPIVYVTGFLSFVIFDYMKPWPIDAVDDQVQGGLGIMLDDAVTAVYAVFGMASMIFFHTKVLS